MSLRDWVQIGRKIGASDLHLEGGSPLVARVGGELQPMGAPVAGHQLVQVGKDTLGADNWAQFMERGSADVSVVLAGTRCRINLFRTIRGLAIAVRLLAPSVHDLKSCNLHPDLRKLIDSLTGLVVISGPTGCGKSTTLSRSRARWNICSRIADPSSGSAKFRRIHRLSSRPSLMPCARIRMYWW
jgi:twitching motility protein PilT